MDILRFENDLPEIGLSTRKKRKGKEYDLVKKYCHSLQGMKGNYALFIEPKIGNSFPDIVIVEFEKKEYERWTEKRNSLEKRDLKILNLLYKNQGIRSSELMSNLGFSSRDVLNSIENLLDSQIIYRDNEKWKFREDQEFGIKSIKAVEAKISNLSHAFKQAKLNRRFASESYVLTTSKSPANKTLNKSEKYGVGLFSISENGIDQKTSASKQDLPLSHASWYFNEWIGRYTFNSKNK